MRRLAVLVVLVAACSGGGGGVNPGDEAGIREVDSVEVEVVQGGGGEQRWLTITAPLAGDIAASLDTNLTLAEPDGCEPTFEIRFFVTGGAPVAFAYGCNGAPLLWGDQEFWDGRVVEAPDGFVEMMSVQISLLSQL